MSWNPWTDAARLRAENSTLRGALREETQRLTKELEHQRMVAKVFHDANHKLLADLQAAERALAEANARMATMVARDPVTGRLLPRAPRDEGR